MPYRTSDLLLQIMPFATIGIVAAGLVANLAAGHQPDRPALAVPTALSYLTLAALWHRRRGSPTRDLSRGTLSVALVIFLGSALILLDRWTGAMGGHLDGALRAAELAGVGFNGHVSTKSLIFIGVCALAFLSARQNRVLTTICVLGLLAICNVAVVDLAMAGALWDRELSVWSTLAAFTLTLAAGLQLRDRSVFSSLFLPGAAGTSLRLMAGCALVLPMAAGWIYARIEAPSAEEADSIARLFGGLGWVLFQMTFVLGYIIARSIRRVEDENRHDALTGLLNKTGIESATRALRTEMAGVLLCDIDHFRDLNEELGHPQGDVILREVAATIERTVSAEGALVGRLWGDVFLVVVPNLAQPRQSQVAEGLRRAIANLPPPQRAAGPHPLSLSVGCSTFIPARMSFEDLLRDADSALHWSRGIGDYPVDVGTSPPPGTWQEDKPPRTVANGNT